ncbi:MAG: hypothetical protein P1U89_10150 [Verrucomicrobiales bacterium]|nr:hypothetical protein [Verrucomicrobiales bacterium]
MRQFFWFLTLPVALSLTGCGGSAPIEISEVREIDPANDFEIPVIAESDTSRFRYKTSPSTDTRPVGPQGDNSDGSPKLTWNTPDGWKELPATSMREPNLRFGPNDEGECYVTRLSGAAGGLTANVNRWRKQVGAAELTDAEVAALPKQTLFGEPATLVSVDGSFAGMGSAAKENYRLHGLILTVADSMVTVKMTGPKDLVAENEAKFGAFCASLDFRTGN